MTRIKSTPISTESDIETNRREGHGPRQNKGPSRPTDSDFSDRSEVLLQTFLEAAKKLWLQIKQVASFVMVELGGYQVFDKIAQWCVRYPHASIILLACMVIVLLPFLILLGFGISTVVMTFTGFLVLEGTLLTILSMLLFGLLGALAIVLIFLVIVVVALYFGFAHIYDLYGGMDGHKTALMNFLRDEGTRSRQSSRRKPNNGGASTSVASVEDITQ